MSETFAHQGDCVAFFSNPDLPSTTSTSYSQLGISLCREKKWLEAIASFKSALEIEPTELATRCNLGLALLQINDLQSAIECLQQVITEDPNFLQARINLGIALSIIHISCILLYNHVE